MQNENIECNKKTDLIKNSIAYQWKRKCLRVNRLTFAWARITRIRSWSLIWFIFGSDCAGNAVAIDASNEKILKKFIMKFLQYRNVYKSEIGFSTNGKINSHIYIDISYTIVRHKMALKTGDSLAWIMPHDFQEDFGMKNITPNSIYTKSLAYVI